MKKFFTWILMLFLVIVCCACENKTTNQAEQEKVFPSQSIACGIALDGKTVEEARAAVEEQLALYTLTVDLEKESITYTAEDLNLSTEGVDFDALLTAITNREAERPAAYSYDLSDISYHLERKNKLAKKPENARLAYDDQTQSFVLQDEVAGDVLNVDAVVSAVDAAMQELLPDITLLGVDVYEQPKIPADSKKAKKALKTANAMLDVSLNYTYPTTGQSETIDREMIASWLEIDENGLLVEIAPADLGNYISEMVEKHSTSSGTVDFRTTGGGYITYNVAAAGQTVDSDAMYHDIAACIADGVSGEREAIYVQSDMDVDSNFGGNYVEIDLGAQHLWVYSEGECVVSTDIVSGSVAAGHATPTGLYTIQYKETNRYLVGVGYKSWVNYWMPFNGGIGLHDADGWRSAYGGNIYQYGGSHGCINMPKSAAAATYSYVSSGTHVIVYNASTEIVYPCDTEGHTWDEGTTSVEATCITEGAMTHTCTVCGESKTESVAMLAHTYANGYCSVCGTADPNYVPETDVPESAPDAGEQ